MQRKNRLAVFEHVPHKERANLTKNTNLRYLKRGRSPDATFEETLTQRVAKKRRQGVRLKNEIVILNCEFGECSYSTDNYYDLLKHLETHINDEECRLNKCLWIFCDYNAESSHTLIQHLTYHAYHTKLMKIGSNALSRVNKLPDCKEIRDFKVPKQPTFYCCEWENCDTKLRDYQIFVDHVKCHANATLKRCVKKSDVIKCEWAGCSNLYPAQYKLNEHVKCHTKEKLVGCPTCGTMFSCITKFYDHRKRQLEVDLQGYQCSQCTKLFASERLLRDHMRIHINHYKCHLCDMTCTKPSCLAKHIRYRHLRDKMFKCEICNLKAITKRDLDIHRATHDKMNMFECLQCNYKCRTKYAFKKHLHKLHNESWENKYACHCCDKKFGRGAALSKHLMKEHGFHLPSGHSRFLYKQNPKTGLLNLQVVRYESIEVTQEMMQGNSPFQLANALNSKYECRQVEGKPFSYILSFVGTENEDTIEDSNDSDSDRNEENRDSDNNSSEKQVRNNNNEFKIKTEVKSLKEIEHSIKNREDVKKSSEKKGSYNKNKQRRRAIVKLEEIFDNSNESSTSEDINSYSISQEELTNLDELNLKQTIEIDDDCSVDLSESNVSKNENSGSITIYENELNRMSDVLISIGEVDYTGNVVKIEKTESGKILCPSEISNCDYKLIE